MKIYTRINFKAVFHSRWIQVIMEKVWNIKLYRQWCYYHSSPKFWRINMRKLLLYLLILIIFGLFLENSDARRFQKAQPRRWRRPKNLRRLQYKLLINSCRDAEVTLPTCRKTWAFDATCENVRNDIFMGMHVLNPSFILLFWI